MAASGQRRSDANDGDNELMNYLIVRLDNPTRTLGERPDPQTTTECAPEATEGATEESRDAREHRRSYWALP